MPYSSGTFSRVHDFTDDRDNGIRIQASRMDAEMDGIATGLSTALLKDGTQTATAKIPFAVGLSVIDNQTILLGTNSDIAIQYDETTNDSLEISANVEGAAFNLVLKSDQGDDNADQHKLSIADGGTLTLGSKISGSFVSYLTHTPNATVASSTLAVAGNLTVGGNLTLGSGAELSEAELEMLDGITAGTVAASKAVVVDANKDIASFRNVTLTGELDAATGDFSGDVDVDGTLEADAITVNGTALATVIAGTTVTTATNANHVSVADNESTNEENLIPFIEDASATGNVGLESDGDFAYNPSTGTVSATVFKGNIDAVDGDFDGTLEADAITLDGTAITATATLDTGISNNNVPKFTSGVADDDFLRVDGTAIEGRSASEVLSDIGASAVAGSSSIVTTGALNAGSITSGFGTIDTGSSNITSTGVGAFGSLDISGDIDVDGTTNLDVVDIDGAVDMASTLNVSGVLTANAGIKVDDITIDGSEIDLSGSGNFTVDVGGNIILDSNGGIVNFKDDGTSYGRFKNNSNTFEIKSQVSDGDIKLMGNDGGVEVTALRLDMSDAGTAHFNYRAVFNSNVGIGTSLFPSKFTVSNAGTDNVIETANTTNSVRGGMQADTSIVGMGAITNHTLVFRQNNTERMRIDSSGNVFIGTTALPSGGGGFVGFEIAGNGRAILQCGTTATSSETLQRYYNPNGSVGSITVSGSATAFNTSSDYRLKDNLNYSFDATSRLKQLKPARFNFIADADTTVDGFLAHEVQSVVPEAITGTHNEVDADGNPVYQGIDQSKLVPLLVKTIQELEARITTLEGA